jgi:2-dehydro-3-deoxygalactonokinase
MVGSRQGWREAPYVEIPATLEAITRRAVPIQAEGLDARILPGLARLDRTRSDVMRGEETQLLGLLLDEPEASGLVCMPGTHAKWVRLRNGRIDDFTTAMTGELFAVLAAHSILRHTIAGHSPSNDPASPGFRAGLERGLAQPERITGMLFALRAHNLLHGTTAQETADELSGLLIGAEIGGMVEDAAGAEITLVASGKLAVLYNSAIQAAGLTVRLVDADAAVRGGLLHAARHLWPILS